VIDWTVDEYIFDRLATKKLLGTKSPVYSLESLLKIGFKCIYFDQPDLTDLKAFYLAIP